MTQVLSITEHNIGAVTFPCFNKTNHYHSQWLTFSHKNFPQSLITIFCYITYTFQHTTAYKHVLMQMETLTHNTDRLQNGTKLPYYMLLQFVSSLQKLYLNMNHCVLTFKCVCVIVLQILCVYDKQFIAGICLCPEEQQALSTPKAIYTATGGSLDNI